MTPTPVVELKVLKGEHILMVVFIVAVLSRLHLRKQGMHLEVERQEMWSLGDLNFADY